MAKTAYGVDELREVYLALPPIDEVFLKSVDGKDSAKIRAGDRIFVKHGGVTSRKKGLKKFTEKQLKEYTQRLWKAQVSGLRGVNGGNKMAEVVWYESPEDFKKRPSARTEKLARICASMASWELILTHDVGYIDVSMIEDTMWLNYWSDSEKHTDMQTFQEWIVRWQISAAGDDLQHVQPHDNDCDCTGEGCLGLYNPETDIQYLCIECSRWYHKACLVRLSQAEQVNGQVFNDGDSIVEHILNTPLMRGKPSRGDGEDLRCASWERIRSFCALLKSVGVYHLPNGWFAMTPYGWEHPVCYNWEGVDMPEMAEEAVRWLKTQRSGSKTYRCPHGHII